MSRITLHYQDIAAEMPYHASKQMIGRNPDLADHLHDHDFHEFVFVSRGALIHTFPDSRARLDEGSLVLVRKHDIHGIESEERNGSEVYNIAVPAHVWDEFCATTGLQEENQQWMTALLPPGVVLSEAQRVMYREVFETLVREFFDHPTRFGFGTFWQHVVRLFLRARPGLTTGEMAPDWLVAACAWAQQAPSHELDFDRFVAHASVSVGHLCRMTHKFLGMTPTEYLNSIRLKRAALMLATTADDVTSIAFDCGYQNLSYFYRRFTIAFGKSPRIYRREMRRAVTPR